MAYRVKLDIFEGPFDLLLFLIRKHEIDIYDIPIHNITTQFLEYIELMKMLDLEVAGEFIEMVAILMNIKARMLLPRPTGIGEEDMEDPRTELVQRLLEYKQFKEVAESMQQYEEEQRLRFSRGIIEKRPDTVQNDDVYLKDVSLFDLLLAFKRALDNMPKITYHTVHRIDVSLEQQSEYLLSQLTSRATRLFSEIVAGFSEKIYIIVTFIALLDLIKNRKIIVRQADLFDDIRIKKAPVEQNSVHAEMNN
jgi:segregation and condensation protein A